MSVFNNPIWNGIVWLNDVADRDTKSEWPLRSLPLAMISAALAMTYVAILFSPLIVVLALANS